MANISVPIQVNLPEDWREQIIERLKNDPNAEWVKVVRCKDCKHRPKATREDEKVFHGFSVEFPDEKCPCQCGDGWYNWYPENNFYCGFGERREE